MKAKISDKGKTVLRNSRASNALVQAIVANPQRFSNGEDVVFVLNGNSSKVPLTFSVKKVKAI